MAILGCERLADGFEPVHMGCIAFWLDDAGQAAYPPILKRYSPLPVGQEGVGVIDQEKGQRIRPRRMAGPVAEFDQGEEWVTGSFRYAHVLSCRAD